MSETRLVVIFKPPMLLKNEKNDNFANGLTKKQIFLTLKKSFSGPQILTNH